MALKGIDVSHNNGKINWDLAWSSKKFDYVILRTGFGKDIPSQVDKQFEINYAECKRLGIPIGAYHYSYAKNASEAIEEAKFVAKILKGKQLEYPVYFDIEESNQVKLGKTVCTDMVTAFCTTLEQLGFWSGVYSYDSFFKSNLNPSIQGRFACWVASVENVKPRFTNTYQMWQYSWKESIPGSSKETDISECYVDYPSLIKKAGKNGYSVNTQSTPVNTVKPEAPKVKFNILFGCGTKAECEAIQKAVAEHLDEGYKGKIIECK